MTDQLTLETKPQPPAATSVPPTPTALAVPDGWLNSNDAKDHLDVSRSALSHLWDTFGLAGYRVSVQATYYYHPDWLALVQPEADNRRRIGTKAGNINPEPTRRIVASFLVQSLCQQQELAAGAGIDDAWISALLGKRNRTARENLCAKVLAAILHPERWADEDLLRRIGKMPAPQPVPEPAAPTDGKPLETVFQPHAAPASIPPEADINDAFDVPPVGDVRRRDAIPTRPVTVKISFDLDRVLQRIDEPIAEIEGFLRPKPRAPWWRRLFHLGGAA